MGELVCFFSMKPWFFEVFGVQISAMRLMRREMATTIAIPMTVTMPSENIAGWRAMTRVPMPMNIRAAETRMLRSKVMFVAPPSVLRRMSPSVMNIV